MNVARKLLERTEGKFATYENPSLAELSRKHIRNVARGYLTTGDVAFFCKVAPRTVSKWFDSGKLKGLQIPGSRDRRIPVRNFIEFCISVGYELHPILVPQEGIWLVEGYNKYSLFSKITHNILLAAKSLKTFSMVEYITALASTNIKMPEYVIFSPSLDSSYRHELLALTESNPVITDNICVVYSDDTSEQDIAREAQYTPGYHHLRDSEIDWNTFNFKSLKLVK